MIELTAKQMADALRKCGGTIVCEGCPIRVWAPQSASSRCSRMRRH